MRSKAESRSARSRAVWERAVTARAPSRTNRVGSAVEWVRSYWRRKGTHALLRAGLSTVLGRVLVRRHRFIWEAKLDASRSPSVWGDSERFVIIDRETLEPELNPRLRQFLGGERAAHDLRGVREGDRLFVLSDNAVYMYSGYVYFDTTAETRRQKRIFAESPGTPVIGTCVTSPAAIWGGKGGIHRRALNDVFRHLHQLGYARVMGAVDAENFSSNRASAAVGMTICRELKDWTLVGHLMVQRVREGGRDRWRILVV